MYQGALKAMRSVLGCILCRTFLLPWTCKKVVMWQGGGEVQNQSKDLMWDRSEYVTYQPL